MMTATAIKGGAPASPTLQQAWDRALAAYEIAQLLHDADNLFGPTRVGYRTYDDEQAIIERDYGSRAQAQATPDGAARLRRAFDRMEVAEQAANTAYLYPLWEAMRNLVRTAAPDIAALRIKIELIDKEEVWNDRELEEDCFELVRADVERLRGEA